MGLENLPFRLDVNAAMGHVRPYIRRTPVMRIPELEEPAGSEVHLKLESLQLTGSFKVRGAASRMALLTEEERERGVVACSSGNHGRAVAHVAGRMGVPASICVPDWVDPVKLEAIQDAGARVVMSGGSYDEAEAAALELAEREDRVFVQPFDDPWVAAGQGTLALELLEDLPELGTVLIPLSGGGLAGGMAYALKEARPSVRVIAVSASRARVMHESLRAGKPVSMPEEETLAEALSGGIGLSNRFSLPLIRELVDEHVLVEEGEIAHAMRYAHRNLNLLVEGGGAVALAAVLSRRSELSGPQGTETAAVIVSGGNVSLSRLQALETDQ
jgi:threonine dehydratase